MSALRALLLPKKYGIVNFVAVYHLGEQGNGTAGEYKDSTLHGYNGQGQRTGSAPVPQRTNGISGGYGQLFDGINYYPNGNFIKVADQNGFSQPTTGYLMMSFWINPTTYNLQTYNDAGQGYIRILSKLATNQLEWQARIYDNNAATGAVPGDVTAYAYSLTNSIGAGASLNKPNTINAGQRSYITILFDPTSVTSWLNAPPYTTWGYDGGFTKRTVTYSSMGVTMGNGTADIAIGAGSTTSNNGFYSGKYDEIRFSNSVRSEAWIIASFYSERDGLLKFGATESSGTQVSQPPAVSTSTVSGLNTTGAILNGSLTSLGSAGSVAVSFQYGTTTGYGNSTAMQNRTITGSFSANLTGLTPGTTYHYWAVATGSGTAYGSDQTFVTTNNTTPPPTTSNTFGLNSGDSSGPASRLNAQRFKNTVGSGSLTRLEVLVNDTLASGNLRLGIYADNNGLPTNLLLDAGSVPATNGWVGISGLNLPVVYGAYYWLAFLPQNRINIVYQSTGLPPNCHDDFPYTYGPLPATCTIGHVDDGPYVMRAAVTTSSTTIPPSVTTGSATQIGRYSATLNASLTSLGSASSVKVSFQYGRTTGYGNSTATQTMTAAGSLGAYLTGLTRDTTYHYRTVVTVNGTTVYGNDRTFTTSRSRW